MCVCVCVCVCVYRWDIVGIFVLFAYCNYCFLPILLFTHILEYRIFYFLNEAFIICKIFTNA